MAAAEIVYDSATPSMVIDNTNVNNYSARIIRPLDRRETPFSLPQMAEAGFEQTGYRNLSCGIVAIHQGWRI